MNFTSVDYGFRRDSAVIVTLVREEGRRSHKKLTLGLQGRIQNNMQQNIHRQTSIQDKVG